MRPQILVKSLKLLVSSFITITALSVQAKEKLTDTSKVWLKGIGPITIGMTIAEAEAAAGVTFKEGHRNGDCVFLTPKGQPENLNFMAVDGKIASVHIYSPSHIKTKSGIGIDSTEAELKAAYPGRIQLLDTVVTDGDEFKIFAFVPKDEADTDYRLIFTLHLDQIQDFAAGQMPQVKDRC